MKVLGNPTSTDHIPTRKRKTNNLFIVGNQNLIDKDFSPMIDNPTIIFGPNDLQKNNYFTHNLIIRL